MISNMVGFFSPKILLALAALSIVIYVWWLSSSMTKLKMDILVEQTDAKIEIASEEVAVVVLEAMQDSRVEETKRDTNVEKNISDDGHVTISL